MTARKCGEGFGRACAMSKIYLQQLFDRLRHILRLDVAIDLLPDLGVGTETASGIQMVAFNGIVVVAEGNLGREKADIADVMLGAGVVAAGQMNVQRRVEFDPPVAPVADRGRVSLGVGSGKLAAGIAGASDQSGAKLRRFDREPDRLDGSDRELHVFVAYA